MLFRSDTAVGDFDGAFAAAPVKLDARYTTPDQSHCMMEPHASMAAWSGDQVTIWTANQMVAWAHEDMATTLGIPKEKIRIVSPFIGGGFGGKLFLRAESLLAVLGGSVLVYVGCQPPNEKVLYDSLGLIGVMTLLWFGLGVRNRFAGPPDVRSASTTPEVVTTF